MSLCRGSGTVISQFRYIAGAERQQAPQAPAQIPPFAPRATSATDGASVSHSARSHYTGNGTYPAWQIPQLKDIKTYHAGTSLPHRVSALVDIGARVSIAGAGPIKELISKAKAAGHKPVETQMSTPMTFQGIGEGCPRADTTMKMPVAVPTKDGGPHTTQMMIMNAPVIKGQGAE